MSSNLLVCVGITSTWMISPWWAIFVPVLIILTVVAVLLIRLVQQKRLKPQRSLLQQENGSVLPLTQESDYATPIDAIETLDNAGSERLLKLAQFTASITPLESQALETLSQKLVAQSGHSNTSMVHSSAVSNLYDMPADALRDEGLTLTNIKKRMYTMEDSSQRQRKGIYSPEVPDQ